MFQKFFHPFQVLDEIFTAQGDGISLGSRARRPAYTVNVVFGVLRDIVIDHVCDFFDMQTP